MSGENLFNVWLADGRARRGAVDECEWIRTRMTDVLARRGGYLEWVRVRTPDAGSYMAWVRLMDRLVGRL